LRRREEEDRKEKREICLKRRGEGERG